jgi:hypothetical protein
VATLLTWSAGKPFGLDISLAFDHQGTLAGAYAGRCEFDSVEAALGRILELDDHGALGWAIT